MLFVKDAAATTNAVSDVADFVVVAGVVVPAVVVVAYDSTLAVVTGVVTATSAIAPAVDVFIAVIPVTGGISPLAVVVVVVGIVLVVVVVTMVSRSTPIGHRVLHTHLIPLTEFIN